MDPQNPFLDAAIGASQPSSDPASNVTGTLTFLLTKALTSRDSSQLYSPELIRAVAAASGTEQREAQRKLKEAFKKDMNVPQWWQDVKEARAALAVALPTELQTKGGVARPNLANAIMVLRQNCELSFDDFACKVLIDKPSPWGPARVWNDDDDIAFLNYMQHRDVNVGSSQVANDAARFVAKEKAFHPVRDWLAGLKWDGTYRLDTWMTRLLGVQEADITYLHKVSSAWMISAVARIFRPGCQAKYMIVLEGIQDAGKSKALRALTNGHCDGDRGVQWFRDQMPDVDHPEIGLYMQGVWIYEVGELSAIRGKRWERVKDFISSPIDYFRRKYGRNLQEYPRQCIFAGSTNDERWGGDPSGLIRFWPAYVTKVNVDAILREREQLWAEATFRFMEGESWWLDDSTRDLAIAEQAKRQPDDAWTERVELATRLMDMCSVSEVMDKLNISIEKQDQHAARVSRALISLGWTREKVGRAYRYSRG